MKYQFHCFAICVTVLYFLPAMGQKKDIDRSYASKLWYGKSSVNFNEAMPIGNGQLGAMIYGGVITEHIPLNHEDLWSGGPRNWNNPEAKKYLPLVREAALSGQYKKADSLSRFMQGPYTESYMPMADLLIQYDGITDSTDYSRRLSLDSALSIVEFNNKGVKHIRTSFASHPDKVIVLHETSSKKGTVSFRISLSSKLHYSITSISSNHIVLKGKCPKHVEPAYLWQIPIDKALLYDEGEKGEGMSFEIHLQVKNQSGNLRVNDKSIEVQNADATTILITAATSYNGYDKSPGREGKNPSLEVQQKIAAASAKNYDALLKAHLQDYMPIFHRVYLNLGKSKNSHLPTNERLKEMSGYVDPEFVSTIAQYGRYILIASSRPGGQPANLKGIWSDKLRPEYSSNWAIDHDAQMFYYAVETNNLSEMHLPFLDLIAGLAENGKQTAVVNYGMRGWCAHHNADVWRSTGASGNWGEGNPHWATWNMAGPWLSEHFYEHYLFTGDQKFLKEKAWPVMKGAAEFCLDWLIEDKSGQLISVPSVSPENTFITEKGDTAQISVNSTGDIALIKELFLHCVEAGEMLKIEPGFVAELKTALSKMKPYSIGSKGQLLEWPGGEWKAVDPAHRHLTHMYPVFPGSEISPNTSPALNNAAKIALSLREKTNGTWGFAWKAACWARVGEGDSAWKTWQYQLQYVEPNNRSGDHLGLFPNLFNSEGSAIIMNGNGCATAVVTEMLIQSHDGAIDFLPALPAVFPSGEVAGIVARGGFEVGLRWENRTLKDASVYSRIGNICRLRTKTAIRIFDGTMEIKPEIKGNMYSFKTVKGKNYSIIAR